MVSTSYGDGAIAFQFGKKKMLELTHDQGAKTDRVCGLATKPASGGANFAEMIEKKVD